MKNTKAYSSKISVIMPLCMVIFIDTFAMTLIYPLFAPLFSLDVASGGFFTLSFSMQIRNMLYGLTMAIYPILMFFASPFLGDLSDKIGRKKVLLLCLSGASIGAGLSGVAVVMHSFALFFTSRIIAGCMAGSLPVAQAAIADISDERDKTVNMSLIGFAYTLGIVLGPIIGGFLSDKNIISWFSFSTPFFVTAILSICNASSLAFTFKETLATVTQIVTKKYMQIFKPMLMFAKAFQDKAIRSILLTCFFYMLGWSVYLQFIALNLFQKYQFTSTQLGYFVGWIGFIMSIAMILIIRAMVKYFTTTQILSCGIILSIIGVFLSMIHSAAMQWIGAFPIACGIGLAFTTITTLFSNAVTAKLQGWIMGVSASTMSIAAGVGGLLTGFISINAKIAFISIIIMWAVCFLFSLQITNKKVTTT
ncbi:MAG: MFS transporter [Gammaproteobacteria bacterium]|nr:MFS transporter [Gammaproteobacteria bacterium]